MPTPTPPTSQTPSRTPSQTSTATAPRQDVEAALAQVRDSLRALIDDDKTPKAVRQALEPEFAALNQQLDKLEHGHIHLAAFGRVSVGKSSVLNALVGSRTHFEVGPLHGVTKRDKLVEWRPQDSGGPVFVIDTPGIDEIKGEARAELAREVVGRSDLVLFVCDGDLTTVERDALKEIGAVQRPVILVLNKCDRYTQAEQQALRERLAQHAAGIVAPEHILFAQADPAPRTVVRVQADGTEVETTRPGQPDVDALREAIWRVLDAEGKTLAALNAGLFAGKVSDAVAERVAAIKASAADRVIRGYCLAKGLAVAANPIPLADLAAAAALDVSLVVHLSRVFGLPITRNEAGELVKVIFTQLAVLMGTVWAVHAVSSVLKGLSAGVSTAATAAAQGGVAWYATHVVGQVAKRYFVQGKSWGPDGPKRAVKAVLETVDRDSVLRDAREAIRERL